MSVRNVFIFTALLITTSAAGCAAYTRSKIELVDQARRGVALVRTSLMDRRATLDVIAQRQRGQLDDAFDADVRAHAASLTDGWVIDARKAYAIGVESLREQAQRAAAADTATTSNLDAIDLALSQLQRMHTTELQFTLPEVTR